MAQQPLKLTPEQNYDVHMAILRHSPAMEYPRHIHMETMANCNAACDFCPYPVLNRQGAKMSDELIEKILQDLTEIPKEFSFSISPLKVSEPFLDVRIFDVMQRINELLPQAGISLTTNASPLTEKKMEQLKTIKNINYIWVSFNDHRKAEYEEVMQLDYDRTINRLDMLHEHIQQFPFKIVLSRVGDGSAYDQDFQAWVAERYPRFGRNIFPRADWLGEVEANVGAIPNQGCVRWFEMSITATGVVAHCCTDGQADYPIGDVTKQSVLEIYNSPDYRKLREQTVSRLHVSPCNQCTFM